MEATAQDGNSPTSIFLRDIMLNPSQLTIGELSSAVKDYGIFITVVIVGWKSRSAIQPCIDFVKKVSAFIDKVDARFERADKHMSLMEANMGTLLNNHLAHLKSDAEPAEKSE